MAVSAKNIYERIISLAKSGGKGKRRADAARYANISESTIIGWRDGSIPSLEILDLVAEFYGVPLHFLVYGDMTGGTTLTPAALKIALAADKLNDAGKKAALSMVEGLEKDFPLAQTSSADVG
jgi:transcriptional regulator with XRE-family HTH domain